MSLAEDIVRGCVIAVQRARSITAETVGEEVDQIIAKATGEPGVMDPIHVHLAMKWDVLVKAHKATPVDAMNAVSWLKRHPVFELQVRLTLGNMVIDEKYIDEPFKIMLEEAW